MVVYGAVSDAASDTGLLAKYRVTVQSSGQWPAQVWAYLLVTCEWSAKSLTRVSEYFQVPTHHFRYWCACLLLLRLMRCISWGTLKSRYVHVVFSYIYFIFISYVFRFVILLKIDHLTRSSTYAKGFCI